MYLFVGTKQAVENILENAMSWACGTYGKQDRYIQGFGGETRGKRTTWKTKSDDRIILKWNFKNWDGKAWTGLFWLRIETGVGC